MVLLSLGWLRGFELGLRRRWIAPRQTVLRTDESHRRRSERTTRESDSNEILMPSPAILTPL